MECGTKLHTDCCKHSVDRWQANHPFACYVPLTYSGEWAKTAEVECFMKGHHNGNRLSIFHFIFSDNQQHVNIAEKEDEMLKKWESKFDLLNEVSQLMHKLDNSVKFLSEKKWNKMLGTRLTEKAFFAVTNRYQDIRKQMEQMMHTFQKVAADNTAMEDYRFENR
ncbi:hypothetical protein CRE_29060 [Caenorhabditis remanei]|uniref:Uncharacterized protein n=1 Tax=Caenorhabditis remanei TaxID=31234 RepID=E3MWB5_CAERE|nr:hypothetical protein CRE_29060 [Caenorhabditis remanei]